MMNITGSIEQGNPRTIRAWVLYDWANSVFQLTIASAIFPVYYAKITTAGGSDVVDFFGFSIVNTVLYSWAIAAAYLVMAVFSPMFSSIADFTGRRKLFMKIFTWMGAVSCGLLFFFTRDTLEMGIAAFFFAWLGYCGSLVFYNSFLPVIAVPEEQDRVSARGYAMGYLGGVVLLVINLIFILFPSFFGISDPGFAPRLAFLTVCIWWIGFAQLTFHHLPKYTYGSGKSGNVMFKGYREFLTVWAYVKKSRAMTLYLFGFLFLMMGVLTVMFMAATFGAKELRLPDAILIGTILVIQLLGMAGAWMFAGFSKKVGNFNALLVGTAFWVLVVIGAYFITDAAGFIFIACCVGIVMGGSQALARSTWSKMLPETHDHTIFFSFYDVMEKLATVAGTFTFGIMEAITGNMRASVLTVAVFFLVSLLFFLNVKKISDKKL